MKRFFFSIILLCICLFSQAQNYDINGDGQVNVADVTSLVDHILGRDIVTPDPDTTAIHEYVDLGLPSGTLWATCNVGADKPEDAGLYFAWGETTGYTSDTSDGYSFCWANYSLCNGSFDTLAKYCMESYFGTVDGKTELEATDDAATAIWGSDWQMPNYDQIKELSNSIYTEPSWTIKNGVNGIEVRSRSNGNSIFIPAAGYRQFTCLYGADSEMRFWSRSIHYASFSYYSSEAYYLYSHLNSYGVLAEDRYYGFPVRPVRKQ